MTDRPLTWAIDRSPTWGTARLSWLEARSSTVLARHLGHIVFDIRPHAIGLRLLMPAFEIGYDPSLETLAILLAELAAAVRMSCERSLTFSSPEPNRSIPCWASLVNFPNGVSILNL